MKIKKDNNFCKVLNENYVFSFLLFINKKLRLKLPNYKYCVTHSVKHIDIGVDSRSCIPKFSNR